MAEMPLPRPSAVEPLFADDTLLVFDKPSGLLAVPGRGADKQDCLAARVQVRYPDALIVHRLDMATSGLMVMARGPAAQRALSKAFAARDEGKRYIAVVAGRLAPPPLAYRPAPPRRRRPAPRPPKSLPRPAGRP